MDGLNRAIMVVIGMIEKVDRKLDELRDSFGKTDEKNIYDQSYRKLLLDSFERNFNRRLTLWDVKKTLEAELKAEIAKDSAKGMEGKDENN